ALVALAAELDQEQGNFRDAEQGLREALSSSKSFGDRRRAALFVRLGALLHRQERWSEAEEVFLKLLEVVDGDEASTMGATCHFYLGNIALQQRRLDEAEELHGKAENVRDERGLVRPLGISRSALGSVALARGDYPTALSFFEAALQLLDSEGDPWDRSFALLGKGRALGQLGDITGAAKVLRQGLEARLGREDRLGEAIARLELAENALQLDQLDQALDETRRAHFHLSLLPEVSLLGDAERLLGRALLRQAEIRDARSHLEEALRIHRKHDDAHGMAEDHSWMLELALHQGEWELLMQQALALDEMLDGLPYPAGAEILAFRLFRGFEWLAEHGFESQDPIVYLRRSYRELMRKTSYLDPAHRHHFLYQIREHQEILNAAAANQISIPVFTVTQGG
ncbi:MAG: tetratricopeptide repeat protein, partial [Holophagales bacterium]|nr:tetratricopeptide repeat protein [Holophagales bacterium]